MKFFFYLKNQDISSIVTVIARLIIRVCGDLNCLVISALISSLVIMFSFCMIVMKSTPDGHFKVLIDLVNIVSLKHYWNSF